MKIAFFSDNFYPELSGIADSIFLTGSELARRGHKIHYFVPKYSARDYEIVSMPEKELELGKNIKIHRGFSFHYPTPTMQGRLGIPNIFRSLSNNSFDVIHTNSFFGPGLDALLFSKIKKIPLVGTNHTIIEEFVHYSPINAKLIKRFLLNYVVWYYNKCDFVSTPSEFLARDMKKRGLNRPVEAASNPVDTGFFDQGKDRNALKKEFGFSDFVILYTGRISSEKGIETLFNGFAEFVKGAPEAMLALVGGGTMRDKLRNEAKKLGLAQKIKFMGPYAGENKKTFYDIYHASEIFATASTSESQCMSMMQAMAAGLPVIGARAAALPEYVEKGHGLLFEPGNARDLARQLRTFHESETMREHSTKGARKYAQELSVSAIAGRWENIYNETITEYGRAKSQNKPNNSSL